MVAFAGALVLSGCETDSPVPPAPTGFFTQHENFIPVATADSLGERLKNYQTKTQHTVIVWIGPLPTDVDVDTYCTFLFNEWTVGRRDFNDGVALFIFPAVHQFRIRVGLGFESAISDSDAAKIGRENVTPNFRLAEESGTQRGRDFYRSLGITQAVMEIVRHIEAREGR